MSTKNGAPSQEKTSLPHKVKASDLFNPADIIGIICLVIGAVVYFFIFKPGMWIWLSFFVGVILIATVIETVTGETPITIKKYLITLITVSVKLFLEILLLCTMVPYIVIAVLGRIVWMLAAVFIILTLMTGVYNGLLLFGIQWTYLDPDMSTVRMMLLYLLGSVITTTVGYLYIKLMGLNDDKPMALFFDFWIKLSQRILGHIDKSEK
ncbi:MAG: hypothetical protein GY757_39355 [bacterium]|nr:hypothetical protein [bacterium]